MAHLAAGWELTHTKLLKALGLEGKHIFRITFDFGVNDVAKCIINHYLTKEELEQVAEVLSDDVELEAVEETSYDGRGYAEYRLDPKK